jgi:hypothetical protein
MRITKIVLLSTLATLAMAQESNSTAKLSDNILIKQEGVKYIKMLGKELKTNLKKAMKEDKTGVKAVTFCLNKAEEITKSVNEKLPKNVKVRRTSLNIRNPKNSPDEIDTKILNAYAKNLADGKFDPKDIKVVKDGNTTRVYKPLLVTKACLKCHGENVSSDIKSAIAKKFPKDKAINLKAGTLRGVMVAEIKNK